MRPAERLAGARPWLVGAGAALAVGWAGARLLAEPAPAAGEATISQTTVTGFVLDLGTGHGVQGAQISTDPPTETVTTNAQGLYVIAAGKSFGTLTVRASAPNYRQLRSTCLTLKAGLNSLGDVGLLYQQDDADDKCPAPCADGEECRLGQCVPACKPACSCTEKCQAGQCVPRDDLPTGDKACGANATWLGGGLCACKPGYSPSPYGQSCVSGSQAKQCPENSFISDVGCECSQGFVPSPEGDGCVPPEEAAVPRPLGDGSVVRSFRLPTGTPRGLASDGKSFFTVDLDSQELVELAIPDEGDEAQIVDKIKVGDNAYRVMDLAADDKSVWLTRRGLQQPGMFGGASSRSASTLIRLDRAGKALTHVVPNNVESREILGLALGDELVTHELTHLRKRSASDAQEIGLPRALSFSKRDELNPASYVVPVQTPNGAGQDRLYLAQTRNQALFYVGTRYDGQSFVADIDVINVASPTRTIPLRILSIPIPGSHVLGLEAVGSRGWLIVAGAGLDKPVLAEVEFNGAL